MGCYPHVNVPVQRGSAATCPLVGNPVIRKIHDAV